MDPLEKAILEGGIPQSDGFGPERRRDGHDPDDPDSPLNTDDELGSALSDDGGEPTHEELARLQVAEQASDVRATQVGRKGGPSSQTGVKGVISDKHVHDRIAAGRREARVNAVNQRLERMAMVANTYDEEDRQRRAAAREQDGLARRRGSPGAQNDEQAARDELAAREQRRERRIAELKAQISASNGRGVKVTRSPSVWFGHLREVDAAGYASAIDRTEESTMVVVHIYSKLVIACARLSAALKALARDYPQTKFLQVRAAAIRFGCGTHDQHADDGDDEEDETERRLREVELEEEAADVVPTLLVYQAGKLVHNLVRVDLLEGWGRGDEVAIRNLLAARGALRVDDEERWQVDSDEEEDD